MSCQQRYREKNVATAGPGPAKCAVTFTIATVGYARSFSEFSDFLDANTWCLAPFADPNFVEIFFKSFCFVLFF